VTDEELTATGMQIHEAALRNGLRALPVESRRKLAMYLDLLMKWNSKLNLTAIREPEEIIQRHFIECIQCAQQFPKVTTLLDFGSGAGFPGIPIAILRPEIRVTLAESQAKKSSFLREVIRTLELRTTVYDGRAEDMESRHIFEAVTLRAVDNMSDACQAALKRLKGQGWMAIFATYSTAKTFQDATFPIVWIEAINTPGLDEGFLMLGRKLDVLDRLDKERKARESKAS
jgi:16S rRNA (guanine527-N7)-methyltransferase